MPQFKLRFRIVVTLDFSRQKDGRELLQDGKVSLCSGYIIHPLS